MSPPTWQETVREAYLSDQASVFMFCGPGVAEPWTLEGQPVDFAEVLIDFLARTREIVGHLAPPRGLSFPGLGDVGHFDRILAAAHLLDGEHHVLQDDVPEEALGKIWIALSQTAAQGYVIEDLDAVYPAHRKHPPALGADAPPLWQWCDHDRIRRANHILFLVSETPDALRSELVQAAHRVELPAGSASRTDRPAPSPPQPPPPADQAAPAPTVDHEALIDALDTAIRTALATHSEDTRPAKIPVLDGAATVLRTHTGSPGPLDWSVDDAGHPVATGDGAEAFLARWSSDIALGASAGMILGDIESGIPDTLSETGLRALARRLARWIG